MRYLIIFLLLINVSTPIFSQENDVATSDITKDLDFPKKGELILACKCLSKDRIYLVGEKSSSDTRGSFRQKLREGVLSVEIKVNENSNCVNIQTVLIIDLDNHNLQDVYFQKKIFKDIDIDTNKIFINQKLENYWITYIIQNYTGFLQITKNYAKTFNRTYYDQYYFQCKQGEKIF